MPRLRSYRARLLSALLILGVGGVALAGWEASESAAEALRNATEERLTAIRETRARQLERRFRDLGNHVVALSSGTSTVQALSEFDLALTRPLAPVNEALLRSAYETMFRDMLTREPHRKSEVNAWFPEDPATLALQSAFIAANPYPAGSRFYMIRGPADTEYSKVHARHHPTFHRYMTAFGFYDMFLMNNEGRLVYSVMKEVDFGVRLREAPYRGNPLARTVRRAMELSDPESFVVEDYAPYLPSFAAPAAFVAAPVFRAGSRIGALAIQLSTADVNAIMTGEGKWAEEGLGRSGQAYAIGPDGTLRSDLRHELENPEGFLAELRKAGAATDLVDRIRRYGTAVLNLKVTPESGEPRGTHFDKDFRGSDVLRSQAPVNLPGLQWTVVAEIEAAEALAPVKALRYRMMWQAGLTALLLALAAQVLAARVIRPLAQLGEGARQLSKQDFSVRMPVESDDELGELASSFNSMAQELQHTTVSKQELDRILGSLINAVFVVEAHADVSPETLFQRPILRLNPAGLTLLEIDANTNNTLLLGDIVPPEKVQPWTERVTRLLQVGRLPAEQATLLSATGRRIPVLLSASWLAQEAGRSPGIVCVAQDISAWKTAQDRLRRMSTVFMDATDPIVVTDPQGGIVEINAEAERTYGWSAADLRGQNLTALFDQRCQGQLRTLLNACLAGNAVRNEETVQLRSDGTRIPALITLSLLTGEEGTSSGVAAISKDISERKRAETEIRAKQEELEHLTSRLLTAQEEERRRLARDLHDDLTQRLAAIAIRAGNLERMPYGEEEQWRKGVAEIRRDMVVLSDQVHGLSRRLHPSTLDDLGLVAAIESECRAFFERGGPPVDLRVEGTIPALKKEAEVALYRVVQESLRNVWKHAQAESVRIEIDAREQHVLRLTVADDGGGFDPAALHRRAGIGLTGMEERARLVGASLIVESRPGRGTQVQVHLPLHEAHSTSG